MDFNGIPKWLGYFIIGLALMLVLLNLKSMLRFLKGLFHRKSPVETDAVADVLRGMDGIRLDDL